MVGERRAAIEHHECHADASIGLSARDNQSLYYLLKWSSLAEREQKWGAFMADPEWLAKRAETERNGPLVERVENLLLAPTTYSIVK